MAERTLGNVPKPVLVILAVTLSLQIIWHFAQPQPQARAEDLTAPPSLETFRAISLGDPIPLARAIMLHLQAFDVQPGIGLSFRSLDYDKLELWLERALQLDPQGQYPLLSAIRLYGAVRMPEKQRQMADFAYKQFFLDPDRRWRWLAYAALDAKHQLHDLPLARTYAQAIRKHATGPEVPNWAKQMEIFLLEDMGETESAKVLLGALLESGQITDPAEQRFLAEELDKLNK